MYSPKKKLMEIVRSAFPLQTLPWDEYFMRMAETDFLDGRENIVAVKSFFMRKAPFGGSFALLGGLHEMMRTVRELRFDTVDFRRALHDLDYNPRFVDYLCTGQKALQLEIYAPPEGTAFFPNEPIVTARGPLPHIRLFEGIATEALNFGSLSLTKWNRLVRAVRPGQAMDFSRRRAQNHLKASLYAMLGGCSSTSNSELRCSADVKLAATFGHEFVQGYGSPAEAFDKWLTHQPRRPFGLVDTLDCMRVDFPAWLDAVLKHQENIKNADPVYWGWRNDSGDLAELCIKQYRKFIQHKLYHDAWFFDRMRIVLTNDLDEFSAQSIISQIQTQAGAAGYNPEAILRRIIWAAGTKPGSCEDQPTLGGVCKLMEADDYDCMKLAFDAEGKPGQKTSIPGRNKSMLVRYNGGEDVCLAILPHHQHFLPGKELRLQRLGSPLELVVPAGWTMERRQSLIYSSTEGVGFTCYWHDQTIGEVQDHVLGSVDSLPWTMTRLDKPEVMQVCLTPELAEKRQAMIQAGVLREDKMPKKTLA